MTSEIRRVSVMNIFIMNKYDFTISELFRTKNLPTWTTSTCFFVVVKILYASKLYFLREHQLCDVILVMENNEIHCHKVILVTNSPYFLAMFSNDLLEAK